MVAPSTNGTNNGSFSFDTQHEDMIHDAQADYYGKRLVTCSSDRTVRIFDLDVNSQQRLVQELKGHTGPVWQAAWAHPKFGNIVASCSYDGSVIMWKETNGVWGMFQEHRVHEASVNAISWAPHELGLYLACASSDGKVSVIGYKEEGVWENFIFSAHQIGCNSVSWSPSTTPGALLSTLGQAPNVNTIKRLVTGGCDNLVKVWRFKEDENVWKEDGEPLEGHHDWVRDVAWAPNIGLPIDTIASCSQDKTVLIWTQEGGGQWTKKPLKAATKEGPGAFPDVVWRVSWSTTGNVLAVSCGDNKVTLWKENMTGTWQCLSELDQSSASATH